MHNSQPWRFRVGGDAVELWCDPHRRTRSDKSGREMLISCGAALFGLRLPAGLLPGLQNIRADPAENVTSRIIFDFLIKATALGQ